MIKIRELLTGTVAHWVERLPDKQRYWARILASVRFFIWSVMFFLLCYPGEVLECTILTEVCII